jgi:hypothetical protein
MFTLNGARLRAARCLKFKIDRPPFIPSRSKNYPKIPGWDDDDIKKISDEHTAANKIMIAERCIRANALDIAYRSYEHINKHISAESHVKADSYAHDSKTSVTTGEYAPIKKNEELDDIDGHACPKPIGGLFHQGIECPYCRGAGVAFCYECRGYGKLCYDGMETHKCHTCSESGTVLCVMCSGTGDSPLL